MLHRDESEEARRDGFASCSLRCPTCHTEFTCGIAMIPKKREYEEILETEA